MPPFPTATSTRIALGAVVLVVAVLGFVLLQPGARNGPAGSPSASATRASPGSASIPASARPSAAASIALAPSPLVGAAGFIRVNQVGYDPARPASARAFLLSGTAATGSTFYVVASDGSVAYQAAVPNSLGSWSKTYGFVYSLDFGGVSVPGTYHLAVSGTVAATSPSFKVAAATELFGPLLANALAFYQAQRDGPNVIPGALGRKAAHLNDQQATVYAPPKYDVNGVLIHDLTKVGGPIDVSGGWADAGDYVKFVQTASYVEDVMLTGIRDFPELAGAGSTGADMTAEARFGLDWLLRMWDDRTRTLYYQVQIGDGNDATMADHDIWRLPEVDDTFGGTDKRSRYIRHRPAFRAGPPGALVSPNLAGRMAADFAMCYQVFRAVDRPYADRCLTAAEHVFDLADTHPRKLLTTEPYDFYPESQWRDDLELGATELARALASGDVASDLPHRDSAFYLALAAHWAHAYVTGPADFDSLNLYDVAGLAHYELWKAIDAAGRPAGLEITQAALVADIKARLDEAVGRAAKDPFGFGGRYDQFDSAAHAFGFATTASEYDELTGTTTYADFGRAQLGVLLGANAWGTSLLVGAGTTFPHCMQHQIANLNGSVDGTPPLLLGAVVNGPNAPMPDLGLGTPDGAKACSVTSFQAFDGHGGHFIDDVASWPTVEPALDYSVGQILAFARAAAGKP